MKFVRFEYRKYNDPKKWPPFTAQLELDDFSEVQSIEDLISMVDEMVWNETSTKEYKLENVTKFFMDPTGSSALQVVEEYEIRNGKPFKIYQAEDHIISNSKESSNDNIKSIW